MTTKPAYVELDGGLVFRPPYMQSDSFLTAWIVRSDKAAQQRLLDRAFNRPSGGAVDYRPLFSAVILSFANIARISSLDATDSRFGHTDEVDTCFWLIAGAYKNGVLDHVVWYVPYIWVSNSLALVAGREVYGYPKQIGWANLPKSAEDPGPLWTDGLVIPHYAPETPVSRERIFTISRDHSSIFDRLHEWDEGGMVQTARSILDRMADLDDVRFDLRLIASLLEDLFGGHLPMVFLKQLRSCGTHDRAAYQAIVEANATVTDFRGAGLLPPGWTLAINQYQSHRVADTLGIDPKPHLVDQGFWVKFSFSMDLGAEIWRAP